MTALTGMNVPAAETSPDDSAVSAEGISFPQDTLPSVDLTTASENISIPPDSPDVETLAMNIPVCADPLKAARQIRAQVEAAAQSILHEQQVESVHSTLNHTQFLLTGESEYLLEDEPETEFVEETESELIEETEAITEVWPVEVDSALLADDGGSAEQPAPETENPSEGEASPEDGEGSTLPGPGHGMFTVPEMRGTNIARLNLYDYRLLRSYPLPVLAKDMHRLYDQTKQLVSEFEGEWSVYVQNLSNGQTMVMNDKPLNSASVMKLFIMETVYEAFAAGTVPRNEDTVYLLRNMIINSSNESSNRLLEILGNGDLAAGVSKVNDFILSHGYTPETVIYNGFQDPAATLDENHQNMVRARDVGQLLADIYDRQFISRKVCNEIEQMMLEQATRFKIPRGVPEGVEVGNKSGETSDTANDAAVIYGPSADYILVVLSHGWTDENTANENVVKVSQLIYSYFEN